MTDATAVLEVTSSLDQLTHVEDWFEHWCQAAIATDMAWLADYRYALCLVLAEAFTNAVRHAHVQRPPETLIRLEIRADATYIQVDLWDFGDPFDPDQLPPYDPSHVNASNAAIGGYGWFLMRKLSDRLSYTRQLSVTGAMQNCLSFSKFSTRSPDLPVSTDP